MVGTDPRCLRARGLQAGRRSGESPPDLRPRSPQDRL